MSKYDQHPLSAAFPAMSEDEQMALADDIRVHGLRNPIVLLEDQVLDGWHRYQAGITVRAKLKFVEFPEDGDPVAFVLSQNLQRRHLTGSQRAAAVVACSEWAPDHRPEKGTPGVPFSTNADMAEAAGVHPNTIKQAKRAHEAGLGEDVRDGKMSAKQASQLARLPENEREAALEAPRPHKAPKEPEPEEDGPSEVEELRDEIDRLRSIAQELATDNERLQADNERYERIFHSDPRIGQAVAEVNQAKIRIIFLENRVDVLNEELNEYKRLATSWRKKHDSLEKSHKG